MEKEYYVYIYLDPRKDGNYTYLNYKFDFEPFYIGKGKKGRAWAHKKSKDNTYKSRKIQKILSLGYDLEPIILERNLSNKEAIAKEIELIKTIGRLDTKTGPLVNLTNGGEGNSGWHPSKETREKISKSNTGKKQPDEAIKKRLEKTDKKKLGWAKGLKRENLTKFNNETYAEAANKIHNKFYDYSKVDIYRTTDRITIICPTHGEFEMNARRHLEGFGCYKCFLAKNREKRAELYKLEFLKAAKDLHSDKYNYNTTTIINCCSKVQIYCPIHGEFYQQASVHLRGCGCQKCALELKSRKRKGNTEDFIEKANRIHNHKYDYSKADYKSSQLKVEIICEKHGAFYISPNSHLSGKGCRKCGIERRTNKVKNEIQSVIS